MASPFQTQTATADTAFALVAGDGGRLENRADVGLFFLALLGFDVSVHTLDAVLAAHPSGVTSSDARRIVAQLPPSWFSTGNNLQHHAFSALDTTGKGFLEPSDLVHAASQCAPHLPPAMLATAFSMLDGNGDGRLALGDVLNHGAER
ncbi:hypothetical protein PTSG_08325 [Salpingoeca rosetta]|uniref:EF-hand domain-containing protein n=1 Tax=Salpingoeca rosetta (strain ATCC 50818 / BSB-021) TaxID=946362 RepID=F2UJD3_SALR5|nr:uncharacterized protein PTSG_08325 [Salpingoeca rosetta]EGD77232.1 hypothetical protein PTSG_08325 [Salpingoeca rosetta]|eukprot:XP_004990576.1 hypothetical protein PTSG_08325 [Salpingoeca rosetta]